jgi:hypothetical protein
MVAGVLVALPSLAGGLVADDFNQRATILGAPRFDVALYALFGVPNEPPHANLARVRTLGRVAWYTRDDYQVAFFRPLTAVTHWLDYRLFDGAPWLMHLHGLAWYAVAIAAVFAVQRRFTVSPLAAGVAALLFAVDDTHVVTVGWLANRNALIALTLGAATLLAHDRWVREGKRGYAVLAAVAYYAALLSAELGVSTLAYLVAYALFLDAGITRETRETRAAWTAWARRALHLLPYVAVTVAWRVGWNRLGFGARGSSLYLDPLASPLAFADAVLHRGPILIGSALGAPHADWTAAASARAIALGAFLSTVAIVGFAWLTWPRLRASAQLRFFAVGALLAVVPICGAQASDRNLAFVTLGASAVFAELLRWAYGSTSALTRAAGAARAPRWLAAAVLVVHGIVSPTFFTLQTAYLARHAPKESHAAAESLFAAAEPARVVVVVRALDLFYCTNQLSVASVLGLDRGRMGLCLSGGPTATTVRRLDARTLLVRPDGGFLDAGSNRLQWDGHRAVVGEAYVRPGYRAEIVEVTPEGEPWAVTFRFEVPLEHPAGAWLVWRTDHYERTSLPAVGSAIRIDGGVVTPA